MFHLYFVWIRRYGQALSPMLFIDKARPDIEGFVYELDTVSLSRPAYGDLRAGRAGNDVGAGA
jgi:hypothetical protein